MGRIERLFKEFMGAAAIGGISLGATYVFTHEEPKQEPAHRQFTEENNKWAFHGAGGAVLILAVAKLNKRRRPQSSPSPEV